MRISQCNSSVLPHTLCNIVSSMSSIGEEDSYDNGDYLYVGDKTWAGVQDYDEFAAGSGSREATDDEFNAAIEAEGPPSRKKGKSTSTSKETSKEIEGRKKSTGNAKQVDQRPVLAKKLKAKSRENKKEAKNSNGKVNKEKERANNEPPPTKETDRKLLDLEQTFREEEMEDFEGVDENYTGPFRSGALSDTGVARAMAAHKAYITQMYEIAKDERKPLHSVFAVVHNDDTPGTVRAVNPWNAWLVHHAAHSGVEKPEEWDTSQWVCYLREEYIKHVAEQKKKLDTNSIREVLAEEVSWFENRFSTFWEDKKCEGKFGGTLIKIIAPIMNIAQHAYLNYGVHIFGYAISTKRDESGRSPSCMFGGSPEFAVVKETQRTVLRDQLTDIEALLRVQEMEFRNVPEEDRQAANVLDCKGAQEKNGRDYLRTMFSRFLHQDTSGLRYAVAIGSYLRESVKCRLVIRNWPKGIAFPGCGGMTFHKLKRKELQSIIDTCIQYVQKLQAGSVTDRERHERKFFKVERWNDGEQDLPASEVGDVAVVTDVDGDYVVTVNDVLAEFPGWELTDGEDIETDAKLSKSRRKSKPKSRMTVTKATSAAVDRSPPAKQLLFFVDDDSPTGTPTRAHSPTSTQHLPPAVNTVEPLAIRVGRRLMKYVEIDNFASPTPSNEVIRFDNGEDQSREDLARPSPRTNDGQSRAVVPVATSRACDDEDSDSKYENLPRPPPRTDSARQTARPHLPTAQPPVDEDCDYEYENLPRPPPSLTDTRDRMPYRTDGPLEGILPRQLKRNGVLNTAPDRLCMPKVVSSQADSDDLYQDPSLLPDLNVDPTMTQEDFSMADSFENNAEEPLIPDPPSSTLGSVGDTHSEHTNAPLVGPAVGGVLIPPSPSDLGLLVPLERFQQERLGRIRAVEELQGSRRRVTALEEEIEGLQAQNKELRKGMRRSQEVDGTNVNQNLSWFLTHNGITVSPAEIPTLLEIAERGIHAPAGQILGAVAAMTEDHHSQLLRIQAECVESPPEVTNMLRFLVHEASGMSNFVRSAVSSVNSVSNMSDRRNDYEFLHERGSRGRHLLVTHVRRRPSLE
ncbi:hypothetical protein PQX77_002527 [Marasmius sp. AFHP31]|nr:hypothetical protein PQX77_002527 [Marasmius sp. AFHP31]